MNYKQQILNDFDNALYSTVYNDYPSPTQNEKTDLLCDDVEIEFDAWLADLVWTFCRDSNYSEEEVMKAIESEPKFREDLIEELEDLREQVREVLEDEEDED